MRLPSPGGFRMTLPGFGELNSVYRFVSVSEIDSSLFHVEHYHSIYPRNSPPLIVPFLPPAIGLVSPSSSTPLWLILYRIGLSFYSL